ncbi:RagB/SusD family nutrient uptake outer membrane protein [Rasiella rasia]|uniref:RagB/SusD family nutrient uptake outer membrane protein n=1 Tax=Rasiella rasia TaxID=2744027 RepID=A0A6G6GMH2_9FLAO|nr:RagB/SusD family nutrient uptake outer membrane protein [Rasiella rasia]QIE59690.1 RagB/SusD family nutrient uptake outer membrane protein [Rasiella rasia]
MKKQIYKILFLLAVAGTLFSCEVEEFSDLNNPEVDAFNENLTRGDLQDLVGGVLYSSRTRLGTYYDDCGVIGREYWRFSSSDPRFTSDLLGGENAVLDNNTFYITQPWASRYRTVKNANLILGFLEAQDVSAQFTNAEVNATKGFLQTFIAYELLLNLNLTDANGIRTDVSDSDNLGPFVSKTQALSDIRSMLEEAAGNLGNGGSAFPFSITSGFSGFDTPASFLSANRAISARVAAYQGDMGATRTFLSGSFLNLSSSDLSTGIYHTFSLGATDISNPMFFPLNATTAGARIMEPSFLTDAEAGDNRLSKVVERDEEITLDDLTGNYDVFLYTSQESSIPIIRNEELILLYAEANISNNTAEALNGINIIRESAGLDPYTGDTDATSLINEVLRQRRYSLYAEGHRWIDMRRYNKLDELPLARPNDDVFSQFPIPLTEGN